MAYLTGATAASAAEVLTALVDAQLMQLVTPRCASNSMGKRVGDPAPQAEINQLLVEYCLKGKQVVRLKSGDPFIFGFYFRNSGIDSRWLSV